MLLKSTIKSVYTTRRSFKELDLPHQHTHLDTHVDTFPDPPHQYNISN